MKKMKQLTDDQMKIIYKYCENNMKELKRICFNVWGNKNIDYTEHDDLFSDAQKVLLESIQSFNKSKAKFETYLTNNVKYSFKEWYRNRYMRAIRNNLKKNKQGRIIKGDDGLPIMIPNISFDVKNDDVVDLKEKIASPEDIFCKLFENEFTGTKVEKYLSVLSNTQKKILLLLCKGYSSSEIKRILKITEKQYRNNVNIIRAYENIRILM